MNRYEEWKREEEMTFQGWDFSHLEGRIEEEAIPWDYKQLVLNNLKSTDYLLDMGTGGGEFLLTLNHPNHLISVTEMWTPNVKLCQERLAPLGITVKQVFNDEKLPFEDQTFDVIINRHESYCVAEVKRILKPNGLFITQQVGGENNRRLSQLLIPNFNPPFSQHNLTRAIAEFKKYDFTLLTTKEYFPYLRFKDIGALIYFAKIIEWEFPNFSVETCYKTLCQLEEILALKGYIESSEHRFIVVAKNQSSR